MPAYVIVETNVTDQTQYDRYKEAAPPAIAAFGGRYLVRGGELAKFEGNWDPTRVVILEFPDLETAKRWYASDEYAEARKLRDGAAALNMVAVEGL
jgi:uncharacterized protein (DUF1330 family)